MKTEPKKCKSIALVIPLFNEEEALDDLFAALKEFRAGLKQKLRVIFVDDHSSDKTRDILIKTCVEHPHYSYLRLSKRGGSHAAIFAGLAHCQEDCAAFVAADLQDPLELLPKMIDLCEGGADVVWGSREESHGQGLFEHYSSALSNKILRLISNENEIPFQPSFALLSARAYKLLVQNIGPRASLIVEIPALGLQVANIRFSKPKRQNGKSKWSFSMKIVAFSDVVISSSYVPLRLMIYLGLFISFLGAFYAAVLLFLSLMGAIEVAGWASIMIIVLLLGGLQILMLGIIGEYLWRVCENTRQRAPYIIEETRNVDMAAKTNTPHFAKLNRK